MRSKMIRTTGRTFKTSRRKLELKIRFYELVGWKKEGNFCWKKEGEKIITFHEVVKW